MGHVLMGRGMGPLWKLTRRFGGDCRYPLLHHQISTNLSVK
jgi:hypothetical protein